jgi:hypothetical protein
MAGTMKEKAEKYLTLKELCAQAGLKPFVLPPPGPPSPPPLGESRATQLWRHISCGWIGTRHQMAQIGSVRHCACPQCKVAGGFEEAGVKVVLRRERKPSGPKKIKLWRHIRCGWIGSRCQMVQVMSNRNSGCPRCRTQHGIMSPEILSRGFERI